MSSGNNNPFIEELYDHAVQSGISDKCLFGEDSLNSYIDTAIDAYRDYVLFRHIFKGNYDESVFSRMMSVDLRSRLGIMAGMAWRDDFESVMLVEPPGSRKTGMKDYFSVARPEDLTLLLRPIMYRVENFEKFASDKRSPYLDDRTWYLYVFATQSSFKGMGYGKKLMDVLLSYVNRHGYRICLETNDLDNVAMYEHFGFKTAGRSMYQNSLEHFNMLYDPV